MSRSPATRKDLTQAHQPTTTPSVGGALGGPGRAPGVMPIFPSEEVVEAAQEWACAVLREAIDAAGEPSGQQTFAARIGMDTSDLSKHLGRKFKGSQVQHPYHEWLGVVTAEPDPPRIPEPNATPEQIEDFRKKCLQYEEGVRLARAAQDVIMRRHAEKFGFAPPVRVPPPNVIDQAEMALCQFGDIGRARVRTIWGREPRW